LAFQSAPGQSRENLGVSSALGLGFPLSPLSSARKDDVERALALHRPSGLETQPKNIVQMTTIAKDKPEVFSSIRY
ncbi:acetate--CoA ligase, partial [Streptococcus suis]